MEAYLDNSATTVVYDEAIAIMNKVMKEDFGNPSSMHLRGVEAEQYLKEAKKCFSGMLKVQEKEIFFTSGGTESNNWAILGTALAGKRKGKHVITTSIEHPSVSAPMKLLEEFGYRIDLLHVDENGRIDLAELERLVCEETILVSVMMVNNEIGTIEPIAEAAKLIKKKNPETVFHVDAIQAFGKLTIYPKRMGIDLCSASSHKIHGPKGIGLLYASEKIKFRPFILGGGQQDGMRSGTDNVPGIAGFAAAARIMQENREENLEKIEKLREYFVAGLKELDKVIVREGKVGETLPYILNVSFLGIRSEVMLHSLEDRGIFVSAGSACSSHKRAGSPTLTAIGCSKEEMESALRFSFCDLTTKEELEYTLSVLRELLPALRKYVRR